MRNVGASISCIAGAPTIRECGCSIWGFGGLVAGPPDENVLTAFNADFTYDNVVTPSDAAGFLSHYVAGTLGADHNNDGEVTDADLAEFILDYAEELQ